VPPRSGAGAALHNRQVHVWLLALAVGCAVFFGWIGYARTLDPGDLGWVFHEDPFTHIMGWEQYRNAPLWQYPITRNALYGLEWSSSIVFTDSIPLAALVLRPLSAILPVPFQYLGWWVLLSLVLQAYFAARLVLLRSDRLRDAALGSVLFATAPVLIERLGLQTGVGSHWLLLWALYLYLASRGPAPLAWLAMLLVTVSVHAYLFVMVGAIWGAHLVRCRLNGWLPAREIGLSAAVFAAVVAWMHVLGYFIVGSGAANGSWRSNADLLSFAAPATGARLGVLRSIYPDPWDGCAYLGAGVLALLAATAIARVAWRRRLAGASAAPGVAWAPLVVVVLLLAVFALTNDVKLADRLLFHYPVPRKIHGVYEMFRGAMRMLWPAYYAVMIAALWFALRVWPRRAVGLVLAAAVALQVIDLAGMGAIKRAEVRGNGVTRPLHDPIWSVIALHYRRLVSVPAYHRQSDWPTLAWFAARHGMGCNIGYLSRSDPATRSAGGRVHLDAVASGAYDPGTVYYFPSSMLWEVARATAGPYDLALVADGLHLLVPYGRLWTAAPADTSPIKVPALGEWIAFSGGDSAGLLVDNWSWPEAWGTWSTARVETMVLPVPPNERVRVTFRWLSGAPKNAVLRVHLDDQTFEMRFPRRVFERRDSFEITTRSRLLDVRFELSDLTIKPNQRPTAIGLIAARIQRASDPPDEAPAAARMAPVLDQWISFAADQPGRAFLGEGWSWGETWGTWSAASDAELAVPVPAGTKLSVAIRWLATAPPGQTQSVRLNIDDHPFTVAFPARDKEQESVFEVTSQRSWLALTLALAHTIQASDGRELGVGITRMRVTRLP
jgi:hypothetical protein